MEAQAQGKSAALCKEGSSFLAGYHACKSCIESNAVEEAAKLFLQPSFAQFLDYCEGMGVDPNTVTSFRSLVPSETVAPLSTNSDGVYLQTLHGTTTLSGGQVITVAVVATITPLNRDDFQSELTIQTVLA